MTSPYRAFTCVREDPEVKAEAAREGSLASFKLPVWEERQASRLALVLISEDQNSIRGETDHALVARVQTHQPRNESLQM